MKLRESIQPSADFYDIESAFQKHLNKAQAGNFVSKDFANLMAFLEDCKEKEIEIEVIKLPPNRFLSRNGKGIITEIKSSIAGPVMELSDKTSHDIAFFIKIVKEGNKYIFVEDTI